MDPIIQALQKANTPPMDGKNCTNKDKHFIKSKNTNIFYIVFNKIETFQVIIIP